jgi:hypothetical protein
MITIRVCSRFDAPITTVWTAIERIETHSEWMRDAEWVRFEGAQHQGVGTAFACLTRVGPLSTTDHFVVTAWEPPVLMAIEHRGAVKGDADFRLRMLDAEHTEFCWEERLRFPWWLGGVVGEQVGRRVLRRLWQGNVARLKATVEPR